MKENTVLVVFIICIFLAISFALYLEKDEHDKRMELIEEKKSINGIAI